MRPAWRVALRAALLMCAATSAARGAFETLFSVVQPMTTTEGLQIGTVTYSRYFTAPPLGLCVSFLAADSRIMDQSGNPVSRNLAYLTGAKAWSDQELAGDTLRVFLDLRQFHVDRPAMCCTDGEIVRGIYDCLLVNAYNSRAQLDWERNEWRSAEFISVKVLGDGHADLDSVVACSEISKHPLARRPPR